MAFDNKINFSVEIFLDHDLWKTIKLFIRDIRTELEVFNNWFVHVLLRLYGTDFWCLRITHMVNKFLVSKETVVLHRWESETGKLGFTKRVDKGRITTVNDLESWRFERQPFVRSKGWR